MFAFLAAACAACALPAFAQQNTAPPLPSASATALPQVTPTPVMPPGALPSPGANSASITLGPKKSKATPAPPKDPDANRIGISGVWEIALQRADGVVYTHFKLTQTGTTLTGQYLDESGKKFPLAGTIDGKKVRIVVTLPTGNALVFSGSEDANTDMVGTLSTASDMIGFTAGYRPKYRWIDNISPGGSALGGGTPYR